MNKKINNNKHEQDIRLSMKRHNFNSKKDMINHLEKVLDWYCKKSDRDIFIVPPSNTNAHIEYLIDEIAKTVRIYAKQINSGKKHDPQFAKFFPEILREVRLH
jgi:hypothetical protein